MAWQFFKSETPDAQRQVALLNTVVRTISTGIPQHGASPPPLPHCLLRARRGEAGQQTHRSLLKHIAPSFLEKYIDPSFWLLRRLCAFRSTKGYFTKRQVGAAQRSIFDPNKWLAVEVRQLNLKMRKTNTAFHELTKVSRIFGFFSSKKTAEHKGPKHPNQVTLKQVFVFRDDLLIRVYPQCVGHRPRSGNFCASLTFNVLRQIKAEKARVAAQADSGNVGSPLLLQSPRGGV